MHANFLKAAGRQADIISLVREIRRRSNRDWGSTCWEVRYVSQRGQELLPE
jgi:hypothetical protein